MRALIVILILAIVAYGIYRNLKVEDGTTDHPGISGSNENKPEYNGEDKEPRPDDEEHDDNGAHE